jgi:hypothetical protein
MRKSIIYLFLVSIFVVAVVSCDSMADLQSSSKLIFKASAYNKLSVQDTVLFTGKAIKSVNSTTGEVIFVDSMTIPNVSSFHKIKCYLSSDSLFTATLTSDIMSSIVNDLVLNHNLRDGKYYFEDGYPDWIDNLGATTLRTQNKEKRAVAWAKFIAQLKLEGRYKE